MSGLVAVPLPFAEACAFVAEHHRHHVPPVGHKFSIGCALDGEIVGSAQALRIERIDETLPDRPRYVDTGLR